MHLGQTASLLALVLNRPEPTAKMVSRLLREREFVRKGPRGRNAPHLDSTELSNFLIAFMACPDSPAVAMDRLLHFANLPLDSETATQATFGKGFALLLDRIAVETWEEVRGKCWSVSLCVDMSFATISADPSDDSNIAGEEHCFSALSEAPDDQPAIDSLPYFGGLETTTVIRDFALFRIAKVVLAGEPDPLEVFKTKSLQELFGDNQFPAVKRQTPVPENPA